MEDSGSFSSLFALVDNHLSKSNIQDDCQPSTSGMGSFRMPSLNAQRGLSDTGLTSPSARCPIPSLSASEHPINDTLANQLSDVLHSYDTDSNDAIGPPTMSMSDSPINDVLAIQLRNMFRARVAKEREEKLRQEELKKTKENLLRMKLEESSCLIDLMPAVQQPGQMRPQDVAIMSSGSSMESVVMPDTTDSVDEELQESTVLDIEDRPVSPKPITQDMSYMLKHKIGKCSPFGKVLCARYKPVAAPYFKVHVPNKIKVFDFATPSPDDIVLARWKRPTMSYSSSSTLAVVD